MGLPPVIIQVILTTTTTWYRLTHCDPGCGNSISIQTSNANVWPPGGGRSFSTEYGVHHKAWQSQGFLGGATAEYSWYWLSNLTVDFWLNIKIHSQDQSSLLIRLSFAVNWCWYPWGWEFPLLAESWQVLLRIRSKVSSDAKAETLQQDFDPVSDGKSHMFLFRNCTCWYCCDVFLSTFDRI